MALQINQYSKTRTDLTIQDDDLLDFDSTEDSGTSYESAKITVSDFLAYVSANVSSNSIYTADDTISADRTLTASGAYTKWNDGDIKIDHTGESDSYGFIIEFSSAERGQLGFNQLLQSAFLELQNFDAGPGLGTFFNAIDGKVAIGHGTPTSTLHVKGTGSTAATTNFLAQNSVGNDLLKIRDDGFVGFNTTTPSSSFHVKAISGNGSYFDGSSVSASEYIAKFRDVNGVEHVRFRNSGRVDIATAGGSVLIGAGSPTSQFHQISPTSGASSTPITQIDSVGGNMFMIRANGRISMPNLPTSSVGLSSGDVWNNSGVLNIV